MGINWHRRRGRSNDTCAQEWVDHGTETGRRCGSSIWASSSTPPTAASSERSDRLAHAQARLGCSVRVICMDHERGRATRVEQDGPVEVVRLRRAASFCKLDHCPDLPQADPRFRGRPAAPAHPEPVDDPRADALRRSQAAGGEPSQRRRQATSASRALQPDRTGLLRPGTADPGDVAALHSRVSRAAALSRPGGRPADRPGPCPIPGPVARGRGAWRSLETLLSRPALVLLRPARVLQRTRNRAAWPCGPSPAPC